MGTFSDFVVEAVVLFSACLFVTCFSGYIDEKERYVIEMIKADLKDVEHALAKLDVGAFGIDELTGEVMSIHKLKVMPTARTNEDLFVLW